MKDLLIHMICQPPICVLVFNPWSSVKLFNIKMLGQDVVRNFVSKLAIHFYCFRGGEQDKKWENNVSITFHIPKGNAH